MVAYWSSAPYHTSTAQDVNYVGRCQHALGADKTLDLSALEYERILRDEPWRERCVI